MKKACVRCATHLTSLDLLTSLASYAVIDDICDESDFGLIATSPLISAMPGLLFSTVSQANHHFLCAVCGKPVDYELAKRKPVICSFCILSHITDEAFGIKKKQEAYSRVSSVVCNIAETLSLSAEDADIKRLILTSGDRQLKIALMDQLKRRGGSL